MDQGRMKMSVWMFSGLRGQSISARGCTWSLRWGCFGLFLLISWALSGCDRDPSTPGEQAAAPAKKDLPAQSSELPMILTTTNLIADLAQQIVQDHAQVQSLMGPDVDPHLYQASIQDTARLNRAHVVLYGGLMLEGKMTDLLAGLRRDPKRRVYALADALPKDRLIYPDGQRGSADPHVWFDAELWGECAQNLGIYLGDVWPEHREVFQSRAKDIQVRFEKLGLWVRQQIDQIPENWRVLVTSHDAFNYFGRAYGMEVVGVQGISTSAQAGLVEIMSMEDLVRQRRLPAIFVENSVSSATIERISGDTGARIGGKLYSDSLGRPDSNPPFPVHTWEGMLEYNVSTLVKALSPQAAVSNQSQNDHNGSALAASSGS